MEAIAVEGTLPDAETIVGRGAEGRDVGVERPGEDGQGGRDVGGEGVFEEFCGSKSGVLLGTRAVILFLHF